MWELDCKEGWVLKNWSSWTVVLEKTLESPLDYKEIKPINPKGNQSCIFIGTTDAEAEAPVFWPPDAKNWLIGKDPCAGKDWRQEEKWMTGWGGWMASPTQWTWVWASSRCWWWTGKPGMLQSMGRRVGHNLGTEQQFLVFTFLFEPTTWPGKKRASSVWVLSPNICGIPAIHSEPNRQEVKLSVRYTFPYSLHNKAFHTHTLIPWDC